MKYYDPIFQAIIFYLCFPFINNPQVSHYFARLFPNTRKLLLWRDKSNNSVSLFRKGNLS